MRTWARFLIWIGLRDEPPVSLPEEPQGIISRPSPHRTDTQAVELLEGFRSQLVSHTEAQQRLSEILGSLSGTMHALPELARQQGRVLETLMEAAARARMRDQSVERGLSQLTEGADRQTQVLGLVQQQLDLNHETTIRVADSLRDLALTLGALSANSERHTLAVETLADNTRRRTELSERMERRLSWAILAATATAAAATLSVIWLATRMPVWQAPSEPITPIPVAIPPVETKAPVVAPQITPPPPPSTEPEPPPPPKDVGDAVPDLKAEAEAAQKALEASQPPAPTPDAPPETAPDVSPEPEPAAPEPSPAPSGPEPSEPPTPAAGTGAGAP